MNLFNIIVGTFWVLVIIYILEVIGLWKIFKKAKQPSWLSLIPIVNTYILYKICWQTKIFWISLVLSVIGAFAADADGGLLFYLGVALELVALIIRAVFYYNLSLSFGHGFLYALGLYVVPGIFMPILGFSSDRYLGNRYEI